jgi:hypothetical protein
MGEVPLARPVGERRLPHLDPLELPLEAARELRQRLPGDVAAARGEPDDLAQDRPLVGADVEAVGVRLKDALEQRDEQLVVADVGSHVRGKQEAPHPERPALHA